MKPKKKNPLIMSGVISLMSLVFLLYVWAKVDLFRVGYQLEGLSNKKATLQRKHDQLQLNLSRLTAPNRIAFEAGERLGLMAPRPEQIVLVSVQEPDAPNHSGHAPGQLVTVARNVSMGP